MNSYGMGMGFGWLIPLLVIVAVIYFISNSKQKESSAKDILDKRYANGEIDEEEYRRKKKTLS